MTQPILSRVARVLVLPRDGMAPVAAMIEAAKRSIQLKMFSFDCAVLIAALQTAQARGVFVQVMLNPKRSSGSRANDVTAERLRASGVAVEWTSPDFAVTHEKSMVVDGATALIATFNFVNKHFSHMRDYGLVVDDLEIVRQIGNCFEADWHRTAYIPPVSSPLALSNHNGRAVIAALIDGATRTLRVQHPKYSDMAILDRLLGARARGVKIQVLCGGHHGISESDMMDTFSALRTLSRARIDVRKQHGLRLHAKLVIADGERAMVGSMNIDRSAFDLRRELGIVFDDRAAVAQLKRQFHQDWADAKRYEAPDPIALNVGALRQEVDEAGGSDPDMLHE